MLLGERLIRMGWATPDQVTQGLAEQQRLRAAGTGERLGMILVRHGGVRPEHIVTALAEQSDDSTWATRGSTRL